MPKYFQNKIAGYYLYYTKHCIVECMHAHASDRKLTEAGSAKLFVKSNGDTEVQHQGILTDRELKIIQKYIKGHYIEMYEIWARDSEEGFYGEE